MLSVRVVYSINMTTHINDKLAKEVSVIDDVTILVDGDRYELVGPTEDLYTEKEYIDWNGAYWVKI